METWTARASRWTGWLGALGIIAVPVGAGEPGPAVGIVSFASGQAWFDLPARGRDVSSLVVVATLSRAAGPFPVRVTARRVAQVERPPVLVAAAAARAAPPRRARTGGGVAAAGSGPNPPEPMPRRTFSLMVRAADPTSAANYLPVQGRLAAVGRAVQVYVDDRDFEAVTPGLLDAIVRAFDERIEPAAAARFGPARDTDGDGRFTVLVTSWLARLGGGLLAVDGLVRPADLDPEIGPPFGNRCDMMFLSTKLAPGPHLETVLAHEYAHAVTFSQKPRSGALREEEGWLDEGIAHLVEDLHRFSRSNLDHRCHAFLAHPERYRLVVRDYYAAGLFRSPGHRGAAYLFLRACGRRIGTEELLQRLVGSAASGVANLEAAAARPFAELFRSWSIGLWEEGLQPAGPGPAGPRFDDIELDGSGQCWSAPGTSARFLFVGGTAEGAVRVEVAGPPEAEIQVATIALPTQWPRLELTVKGPPGPGSGRTTGVGLHVAIRERAGVPVRLESLAWPGGRLDADDLRRAFGSDRVPVAGWITLPLVGGDSNPGSLQVVGRDDRNRRTWAWADLPAATAPPVTPEAVPRRVLAFPR